MSACPSLRIRIRIRIRIRFTLETGDWRLETGDWRLETGDWRLETGDWRLENACEVSENRRPHTMTIGSSTWTLVLIAKRQRTKRQ
jgi:hypothetical protein